MGDELQAILMAVGAIARHLSCILFAACVATLVCLLLSQTRARPRVAAKPADLNAAPRKTAAATSEAAELSSSRTSPRPPPADMEACALMNAANLAVGPNLTVLALTWEPTFAEVRQRRVSILRPSRTTPRRVELQQPTT